MAALKSIFVLQYSVGVFTFSGSGSSGLQSSTLLFGNSAALNPGKGGMRDVASANISHEQTQSTRVCCFQTLYFQRCSFHVIK